MAMYPSEKLGGGTINTLFDSGELTSSDWTDTSGNLKSYRKIFYLSTSENNAFDASIRRNANTFDKLYGLVDFITSSGKRTTIIPLYFESDTNLVIFSWMILPYMGITVQKQSGAFYIDLGGALSTDYLQYKYRVRVIERTN